MFNKDKKEKILEVETPETKISEEKIPEVSDKKKMSKIKIIGIIILSLLVVLVAAGAIAYNYFMNLPTYETPDDISMVPSDLTEDELAHAVQVPKLKNDGNIINILLIGEESMDDSGKVLESNTRGRSDVNIILTINRKKKTVKLISFLRDTYVDIPGYRSNKLNAAYQFGGGPLLKDTLQHNFGVISDGYIRVRFTAFRDIIDALGGVTITLTESEARFLQNTNYISKRSYRNVKAGKNHFNGAQVLGYCRIRRGKNYEAVTSIEGHNNDWGRVERQKNVLKAIFNKYKTKSLAELVPIATQLLQKVTTDMKHEQLLALLGVVMDLNIDKLETISLPMENEYTPTSIGALQVDKEKMSLKVSNFINGIVDTNITPSPTVR